MTNTTPKTILITGASGKFGRHSSQAFAKAGWTVRHFDRARDTLMEAARGADAIVMGMHPPSYQLWDKQLLPLHRATIAAAEAHGVPVIVPGNLYGFGPSSGPVIGADTPMRATNPLGRLRAEMEQLYRNSTARTIMLYCGDFIDDRPSGNWFDMFVAKNVWKGRISYPGELDVPHAWCWLPDAARIAVMLAERAETLDRFQPVPVPGLTLTAHQMAEAMSRATGRAVTAKRMSWLPLHLMRPVMPVLKGVFEMRYLWSHPHRIDPTMVQRLLPDFVPTDIDSVLRRATARLAGAAPDAADTTLSEA